MMRFLLPLPALPSAGICRLLLLALFLSLCVVAQGILGPANDGSAGPLNAVSPADCFPMEQLAPADRALGERWLLEALDKEALYTVAADLKPATLSFLAGRISVTDPSTEELESLRQAARIVASWRCGGDLGAVVVPGTVVMDGKRVVHVVLFRRSGIRTVIEDFAPVFGGAGIVPELAAEPVLATVEMLPPPLRHRAWGHLLGYPAYAVDFFARADEQQRAGGDPSVKGIVPRDFISVPTFARETNHFVWAAPKGHQENEVDRSLRARAAPVLARYRELREQHIREKGGGVLALVRALLCEQDRCGQPASSTVAGAH